MANFAQLWVTGDGNNLRDYIGVVEYFLNSFSVIDCKIERKEYDKPASLGIRITLDPGNLTSLKDDARKACAFLDTKDFRGDVYYLFHKEGENSHVLEGGSFHKLTDGTVEEWKLKEDGDIYVLVETCPSFQGMKRISYFINVLDKNGKWVLNHHGELIVPRDKAEEVKDMLEREIHA